MRIRSAYAGISNSIADFLLLSVVFLMPCTAFRIAGLKISEILLVLMVIIKLVEGWRLTVTFSVKIGAALCLAILASASSSLLDPMNSMIVGLDEGIYYSFDYGWLIKLARLILLVIFSCAVLDYCQRHGSITHILNAWILGSLIVGVVFTAQAAISGNIGTLGISRNPFLSVEPSEAGFINCAALVVSMCLFVKTWKISYALSVIVLAIAQLIIGSTASLIAVSLAIVLGALVFVSDAFRGGAYSLAACVALACVLPLVVMFLSENTNILQKIINWEDYTTVAGSSVAERMATFQTCWDIWKTRPILGVGIGNFGWYLDAFLKSPYLNYVPGGRFQPNNTYLQLLAELGTVGFLIFSSAAIFVLVKTICAKPAASTIWLKLLIICLCSYLLIHGFTLPILFSFQFWLLLGFFGIFTSNPLLKAP